MSYARIDVNLPHHRKFAGLSAGAFGMYCAGLCYCQRYETDGVIRVKDLPTVLPCAGRKTRRRLADVLAVADLWTPDDRSVTTKWTIRDYLEWNRSKAEIDEIREKTRRRQGKHRGKSNGVTDAFVTQPECIVHSADSIITDSTMCDTPPDPTPSPDASTRSALVQEYARRWSETLNEPWFGHGKAAGHIDLVAAWCAAAGKKSGQDEKKLAIRIVGGMFLDEWMTEHRYPWGAASQDPGRFASLETPSKSGTHWDRAETVDERLERARVEGNLEAVLSGSED